MLARRAFALVTTASVNQISIQATANFHKQFLRCLTTQKCQSLHHPDGRHLPFSTPSVRIPNVVARFFCDAHRKELDFKVAKSKELLKDAIKSKQSNLLEKKEVFVKDLRDTKSHLREKKDVFVKDLRETKSKVRGRVQEKVKQMREDIIVERENIVTIPNLLCVGRGLLAPVVGYAIVQEQFMLSIGLLAVAGLTDLVSSPFLYETRDFFSETDFFYRLMVTSHVIGHRRPANWARS